MNAVVNNPSPARDCGECTACCSVMEIPRLAKPAGVSCHNLGCNGCNIYDSRPDVPCKTFTCAWLQGLFSEDQRPDKAGAIIWQSLINYRLETIVSQLPGMDVDAGVMEILDNVPTPVRIERIGQEPEYLKEENSYAVQTISG